MAAANQKEISKSPVELRVLRGRGCAQPDYSGSELAAASSALSPCSLMFKKKKWKLISYSICIIFNAPSNKINAYTVSAGYSMTYNRYIHT